MREFTEFEYLTLNSGSRARRVIAKAEVMTAGHNPRFIVTNLPADGFKGDPDRARFTPTRRYEECSCARGEREHALKQPVPNLEADKTVGVRRVHLLPSRAYPRPDLFHFCHARLMQLTPS